MLLKPAFYFFSYFPVLAEKAGISRWVGDADLSNGGILQAGTADDKRDNRNPAGVLIWSELQKYIILNLNY